MTGEARRATGMIPCYSCHLSMIDRLDTHLPEWQRRSKGPKQSLPWTQPPRDPAEARAVVEILKRESEASDRSMEEGEPAENEHTLKI